MQTNLLNKLFNLIIIIVFIYIIIFMSLHLLIPQLGDVTISVLPSNHHPEIQEINISTTKLVNKYYILIYEDAPEDNWLYFNNKIATRANEFFISEFVPSTKNKHILLEGNKSKNTFTFNIKSKVPISTMANKEFKFHLYYIVPYDLSIFPTFYYTKHFVFYIDPIM